MKQKAKGIAGILIMLAALIATYYWVSHGQAIIQSTTLLVAKSDIPRGTEIEDVSKYFKPGKVSLGAAVTGALKPEQSKLILGRKTQSYIPANSQVVVQYFSDNTLQLREDQFTYKLPPAWVYSVPTSIRRGDKISIYEIDAKIESRLNAGEDAAVVLTGDKKTAILDTTVQYVKDSTNREVTDTNGRERFDGTAQVSYLEIICTRDDTRLLEDSVAKGKKLIVVYR